MKTKKIFLRVTKSEKKQLVDEAARRGMTQSELIRSMIARLPELNKKPSYKDGA
ncbi:MULTISPECIES: plasmid mobilization protein [unclassified Microcoleus]|uniref:plasmid mobilization protein n=1 Tax=unclassified Microcoleus TaxID=2642155 RepID=UPI002FD0324E